MEGLADYVSLKVFAELTSYASAKEMLMKMREQKKLESLKEDALKGRHYFVGAVLAFALDEMQVPNWKERIEQGASIQQLLEENLEPARVIQSKRQFDWNEILESTTLRLNREKEATNKLLSSFHDQEGVIFHISIPNGPMTIGGRFEKSCPLDDNKTLFQKDLSTLTSGDQKWKLTFDRIPFVIEDRQGNRTFKIAPPLTLTLDHQKIELQKLLKENQVITFDSISFQNNVCTCHSSKKGKIFVQNGSLHLMFE